MSIHSICFYAKIREIIPESEYPQHMFLCKNKKNYPRIVIRYSSLKSPLILMLFMLGKNFSRRHFEIFFLFFFIENRI